MNRAFLGGMEPIDSKSMNLILLLTFLSCSTIVFSAGFHMSGRNDLATPILVVGFGAVAAIVIPWTIILIRKWNTERKDRAKRSLQNKKLEHASTGIHALYEKQRSMSGTDIVKAETVEDLGTEVTTEISAPASEVQVADNGGQPEGENMVDGKDGKEAATPPPEGENQVEGAS